MRAMSAALLLVLFISTGSLAVEVKDGDWSFPLEAVKKLKELMDVDGSAVCDNPALPWVFLPLCREEDAAGAFSRLADVAQAQDACEICANPSCYGCLL